MKTKWNFNKIRVIMKFIKIQNIFCSMNSKFKNILVFVNSSYQMIKIVEMQTWMLCYRYDRYWPACHNTVSSIGYSMSNFSHNFQLGLILFMGEWISPFEKQPVQTIPTSSRSSLTLKAKPLDLSLSFMWKYVNQEWEDSLMSGSC